MTARRSALYINDIIDSIQKIEKYLSNVTEKEFYKDEEKQDAIIRRLEIIGEATKHIPPEIRGQYPDVAWREITAMRNIIVHEYFGVTLDIIWDTIINYLPDFKKVILQIKSDIP